MKKYTLLLIGLVGMLSLHAQCIDNGNYWNQSWVSCKTAENPNPERGASYWIMYEFDEPQYIDTTHIWNANRPGESGWGAMDVVIDYSPDGIDWEELGHFVFPQAPESNDYTGFQGPEFDGVLLEKILITILSTHDGGDCASLAEVQFKIDQTACYGIVDECGVCDGPGALTWYLDADADGLGDADNALEACTQPAGYVDNNLDLCDDGALGWSDIGPLFQENDCTSCHGGNAAGGLDLRSYSSTAMGGNICGTSLLMGTRLVDIINVAGYDGCGTPISLPSMNGRVGNQVDAEELARIQTWINGGAPEFCTDVINTVQEVATFEFNLYPNPTSDIIHLEIPDLDHYEVLVYGLDGRQLLSLTNPTSLPLQSLPGGMYLVEVIDLDSFQKETKKVVKMN